MPVGIYVCLSRLLAAVHQIVRTFGMDHSFVVVCIRLTGQQQLRDFFQVIAQYWSNYRL